LFVAVLVVACAVITLNIGLLQRLLVAKQRNHAEFFGMPAVFAI
jgi:hypothetical protein